MKERPILFSAPMVRAILDGRKTQTRRIAPVSKLDIRQHDGEMVTWSVAFSKPVKGVLSSHSGGKLSTDQACRIVASQFCPYGQPGDRLWVRETWARDSEDGALFYRADVGRSGDADDWERNRLDGAPNYRWRPSIHMPRAASRITLEITGVRVERLQDISEADARAEGSPPSHPSIDAISQEFGFCDFPRSWYAQLWDQINGAGSWNANPWVWVVEFRRVAPCLTRNS